VISMVEAAGRPRALGFAHGAQAREAVRSNVGRFWTQVERMGYDPETLLRQVARWEEETPLARLEEVRGIALGSGVAYEEVLAMNRLGGVVSPDECSVAVAHGSAGRDGHTIFLKNSDKVGGPELSGPGFCCGKEINVLLCFRPEGEPAVMGVGAAGTTGFKFGCSDRGIAVGSNIARTVALKQRNVDLTTVRAADRAQLGRDALRAGTAREAALYVAGVISRNPMGTPGNMEFVGADEAWFLEGSYDRVSLLVGRDDVFVRTNRFQVLHELNDPEDLSSYCRYVRAMQLVRARKGSVDVEAMIGISMDHGNGPGMNSICRHDPDSRSETSLSAGVVDIDPERPERTAFHVCVGKPCHAWRSAEGHVTLTFDRDPASIPASFFDGAAWRAHYTEEPHPA
jgi:hypothetical protein